jgi:hypothetical protein
MKGGEDMKKAIAIGTGGVVMTIFAINSVFAQTATPSPTSTSPTTTVSPSPTGSVQGATVPGGAPNTGFGGN